MRTFDEYAQVNTPGLLRLAAVLSGDRHLAEDLVQEVLLRASGRWDRIGDLDLPDAYVRRMVVNQYLSWRRKWGRISPRPEIDTREIVPDPAEALAARDELATRLQALPVRQRTMLVLRYYEDMPDGQIPVGEQTSLRLSFACPAEPTGGFRRSCGCGIGRIRSEVECWRSGPRVASACRTLGSGCRATVGSPCRCDEMSGRRSRRLWRVPIYLLAVT